MVRGILLDVDTENLPVSVIETEEDLDSLYNILNCGTIDIF